METNWIAIYSRNTIGQDWVVGDIHGHFTRLQITLDAVGFDPTCDRLFTTGDLIDRGPESELVVDWLSRPYFIPVRGNHDDYAVRYERVDTRNWIRNGGLWFQGLSTFEQRSIADELSALPLAIEVETAAGTVGIVHADPIVGDWRNLAAISIKRRDREQLMWSRERYEASDDSRVQNIDCVCVGHTPVAHPELLGNVWHLDTAGWADDGYFSVLKLDDLINQAREVDDLRSPA